jgi:hypothetical protein
MVPWFNGKFTHCQFQWRPQWQIFPPANEIKKSICLATATAGRNKPRSHRGAGDRPGRLKFAGR